jgi:fructose-1,6-bisphosphatase/inositol monophosphatase family enzyme
LNCAAHEYLRVAKGLDQFVLYSRLKPWDHVPGVLMVQEAGGYAAMWTGKDYEATDNKPGLIAAADKETWDAVYDAFLREHFRPSAP